MSKKKRSKLLALYLPYVVIGLLATNLGEAWRLAVGKELGDKIMSLMGTIPAAFANPLPSLHPLDLLVGLCCGAAMRLAVYLKGKRCRDSSHQRHDLIAQFLAHSQPPCFTKVGRYKPHQDIGQIERQQLGKLLFTHRPRSSCLCRTLSGRFATDCARSCSFASTEGRLVLSSTDAEYSLNAALKASVSCALK